MTLAFFLVITCMHPRTVAVMKHKSWERCQAESRRFKQHDDKDDECIAQCVGDGIYKEIWKAAVEKK